MATSKAYLAAPETAITFDAAGTTVVFTQTSLATQTGRQSAQHDFGDAARAYKYRWRAKVQFATAPVVGEAVDFYYKSALTASTVLDNDDGTGDADLSAEDKLKNLHYIGSIIVDEAVQDIEMVASGVIDIYERFIHIVCWNDTADALTATSTEHSFILTPISIQGQAT
jgi:hypothetical protein